MRVLIVEDDARLAKVLATGFSEHGIEVVREPDYSSGDERLRFGAFDVVILDLGLPDGNGIDLCRRARRRGDKTPILMLTARDTVEDRVRGLETGADDYLVKPFAFPELLARIHALARRQPLLAPERHRIADLEVDLRSREVRRAGRPIQLTAKEFALLECFVRQPNVVLDRARITARVWDDNYDPFTHVVEVLVKRLRRKIDAGFTPQLIHTVRGAGYRFGP